MKILDLNSKQSRIVITREELLIVNAGLNEICNGIAIFGFESRIGASRERTGALLKVVRHLLDKMNVISGKRT